MRKKLLAIALTGALSAGCLGLTACGASAASGDTVNIRLSDSGVTVNGRPAGDEAAAVYTAHDIVYYEAGKGFTYGAGTEADEHSAEEAAAHTVVHITQPGTYSLSGTLSAGQIAVDLGEEAEKDPEAVVTLILNGVDITCTVAPAVIFYNVYECGSADPETAVKDVDTAKAGANVIVADRTTNTVNGSYVARIYKSYTLSEDGQSVVSNKKLHKYDGAFYSKMSMNVNGGSKGTGVLDINAENEGLDAELHLTINGGVINIRSGNDGINTNEDGVSVTTINGGTLTIDVDGATGEGDGIDSNGWLVINGGSVTSAACGSSQDGGIDADMGIYINGGTVLASGNMYDQIDGSGENFVVLSFASRQAGGTSYTLKNDAGAAVATLTPANDCTLVIYASPQLAEGNYTLWQGDTQLSGSSGGGMGRPGGFGGMTPPDGQQAPEGMTPPDGQQAPEGMTPPDGQGRPDGGQRPDGQGRPDGMMPPDGQQMPEGMTPPDGQQMPEGMTPPDGQQMPEGFRPGGFGGQGEGQDASALSSTLTIQAGANFFSNISGAIPARTFADVGEDSPYRSAVSWAAGKDIAGGYEDDTFRPNEPCTHNHILTFIWRANDRPQAEGSTDFERALNWAKATGMASEDVVGENVCTRASAVQYLWKLAGSPAAKAPEFEDVSANADYAQAVSWAVENGIVGGYGDNTFRPGNTCTRGNIAAFLYRQLAA